MVFSGVDLPFDEARVNEPLNVSVDVEPSHFLIAWSSLGGDLFQCEPLVSIGIQRFQYDVAPILMGGNIPIFQRDAHCVFVGGVHFPPMGPEAKSNACKMGRKPPWSPFWSQAGMKPPG
jgi:hypothetical protein